MTRQMTIRLLVTCLFLLCTTVVAAEQWDTGYHLTGADDRVSEFIRWQGDVIVGGSFSYIGDMPVHCIARRVDDQTWEQFGQPLPITGVHDFCVHDGALHLLGATDEGGRIWRLVGTGWQPVGGPISAAALASYDGTLHAGPYRWKSDTWVDVFQTDGVVLDLTVHDGLLVAGGNFETAAGLATGPVAAWDGGQVLAAYPGQTCAVRDVEAFGGRLYAARSSLSGTEEDAVQVWDDGAWVDMPEFGYTAHSRYVTSMEADTDRLLVCIHGHAVLIKYAPEASVLSWDGRSLTSLYYQPYGHDIYAALEGDDGLLLGGRYTHSGVPAPCTNLAVWRDGSMHAICPPGKGASRDGMIAGATELASGPDGLAMGGGFTSIGGASIGHAVVLDGAGWNSRSTFYPVDDLVWQNGILFGLFCDHHVGPESYLGSWEDDRWVIPSVWPEMPWAQDLEFWNGRTLLATDGAIKEIVDGFLVTTFADIPGGTCREAKTIGSDLVAGGDFTEIDGVTANNIAVHDGVGWRSLGDGVPSEVRRLGEWQGRPVVARAGDSHVTSVVSIWDGAAWQDIGVLSGAHDPCGAIEQYGDNLYIGGDFDSVDGEPLAYLASWNGSDWQPVGAINGGVYALAVHDDALWIGGAFSQANGHPSAGLAVYHADAAVQAEPIPAACKLKLDVAPNPFNPRTVLRFELPADGWVRLDVHDVAGRRCARILDGPRSAGSHAVTWAGEDDRGQALPSGVYLVRIQAGAETTSRSVSLVR